jgi:hypothetical protein
MSLSKMSELAVRRELEASQPVVKATAGKKDDGTSKVKAALTQVADFIPTEALGIYVTGLGLFTSAQTSRQWLVFFVALALIPVFVVLSLSVKGKAHSVGPNARTALILSVMGICAFVVWVAALPNTPFVAFVADVRQLASLAALVLAAVFPSLAKALKVA